jgi:hypothetical protein
VLAAKLSLYIPALAIDQLEKHKSLISVIWIIAILLCLEFLILGPSLNSFKSEFVIMYPIAVSWIADPMPVN